MEFGVSWAARGLVVTAGSVMVAALVVGCSSDSASGPDPISAAQSSSTRAPSTPTSPVDVAGQAATAVYLGMWADMAAAAETSNWQDPRLGQHATGTALTNITRGLYADKANGLVTKGRPQNNPHVSSAEPASSPNKVIIADCGDDSQWQHYRVDNGQLANDGPSGHRQINAVVEKQSDGTWRVTDFGIHEVGTCT